MKHVRGSHSRRNLETMFLNIQDRAHPDRLNSHERNLPPAIIRITAGTHSLENLHYRLRGVLERGRVVAERFVVPE